MLQSVVLLIMQADTRKTLIAAPERPTKNVTPLANPSLRPTHKGTTLSEAKAAVGRASSPEPNHKTLIPIREPPQSPRKVAETTQGQTASAVSKLGAGSGHLTGVATPADPISKVSAQLQTCTNIQSCLPDGTMDLARLCFSVCDI